MQLAFPIERKILNIRVRLTILLLLAVIFTSSCSINPSNLPPARELKEFNLVRDYVYPFEFGTTKKWGLNSGVYRSTWENERGVYYTGGIGSFAANPHSVGGIFVPYSGFKNDYYLFAINGGSKSICQGAAEAGVVPQMIYIFDRGRMIETPGQRLPDRLIDDIKISDADSAVLSSLKKIKLWEGCDSFESE
ncbi:MULTISPECIES: hypothetical protein [unclassified Pseudomonas]|uniref:hypothetical protein n=1 Tax=unclassified Pseudomonas TaxID=196821 RepID=UPI0030D75EDD